ncbi:PEGA domain-containing protein [Candidatus Saccharibacteria bacterium]|nr:PEGA domain-containing protein [Candidatus Saccharibacteria bacterium]
MDYLDPQKKKQKKIRLMLMYALLGIAIAIATVVMVYLVNGYTVDKETGEVVQNSLLYLDSKPESAEIYLNGEKQRGRTDARLVIPEGNYSVEMRRSGYRNWSREILLEGGSLRRLTYARLVPERLDTEIGLNLPVAPTMISQSNDKRWLLMAFTDSPLKMRVVDLERPQLQLVELQLPLDLLTSKAAGTWEAVEWADDNKTILARYTTSEGSEYVLVNRENGTLARNVQAIFPSTTFKRVELRARKNDQLYLFDGKSVLRGNIGNAQVELVQDDVIDFEPYGDDVFLFVTSKDTSEGMVWAYLRRGTDSYKLRELKKSDQYLMDISKLGNALVMGVGSVVENRVIVYNDPINALKKNDFSNLPVPTTVMKADKPEELAISADSSVIIVRGESTLSSHEFEADRSYSFKLNGTADKDSRLRWMDGQHFTVSINNVQWMSDFDGSNQYELVESSPALGASADKDFDFLFTYLEPESAGGPYRMMRTFMRTPEDR